MKRANKPMEQRQDTIRIAREVRALAVAVTLGALAVFGQSGAARAQDGAVVAIVNGLPITTFDIPQRQRLLQFLNRRPASRQEALEDIIADRVRFTESVRNRMQASDADVDAAYTQVATRSGFAPASFDQVLRSQGIEPRVYRGKLRADISWSRLVRARFGRTIFITDAQLTEALSRRTTGAANQRPVEYTFRQIVVVVPPNASPAVVQRRAAEATALRNRFTNCQTGADEVRQMTDAAIRDPVRRASGDLSDEFRRILDATQVGRLTPPSRTQQGFEMVAVCSRAEQRADDITVRNQTRDELTVAEMQRISRDYYQRIRRQAVIEYRSGSR